MCTAKLSISSWWILALMSLFLWYRNIKYDRALSVFIFTLSLVQLIEYGIYSGADPTQSGRTLYISLWLQCLVLAIGVYMFIGSNKPKDNPTVTQNVVHKVAGWNMFLYAIIFVVCLILSFSSEINLYATVGKDNNIYYYQNGSKMFNKWGWLYLIGIFLPLFFIFIYYAGEDLEIAILLLYGVFSLAYVTCNYNISTFSGLWCYLSVGFAFLCWFLGIIPLCKSNEPS